MAKDDAMTPQVMLNVLAHAQLGYTMVGVAGAVGVHRSSIYRAMNHEPLFHRLYAAAQLEGKLLRNNLITDRRDDDDDVDSERIMGFPTHEEREALRPGITEALRAQLRAETEPRPGHDHNTGDFPDFDDCDPYPPTRAVSASDLEQGHF